MHFANIKKPSLLPLLVVTDAIGIIGLVGCLIDDSYESMFYVIFIGFGLLIVQTPIELWGIVESVKVRRYVLAAFFTAHWVILVALLSKYTDSSSGLRQWLFGLNQP